MKKKIELTTEELVHVVTAINDSFLDLVKVMSNNTDMEQQDKDVVIELLTAHNHTQHYHLSEALKMDEEGLYKSIMQGIEERRKQQETLNN